jgi:cytoplasmic iron level regulating protein YaaA (DUF328/UPF0246 family)
VLILLPPSEGKTAPRRGQPVDPGALSLPGLAAARERVLDTLTTLCAGDQDSAVAALGLTDGLRGSVLHNAGLRTAPAAPAGRVYTGVLYGALGLATLSTPAKRWVNRSVLVSSGLWGAVRLTDRIPAYRCPIGGNLPGLGPLSRHWRAALRPVLDEAAGTDLVLDLRSGAYGATWPAPAGRSVTVRVLQARTRTVVSHFNKATKGRLVRDLAEAGARPRTATALMSALSDLGYRVEVDGARLDVLVDELI